jgi:hypothetical protein
MPYDLKWFEGREYDREALLAMVRLHAEHRKDDEPRWAAYLTRSEDEMRAALGKSKHLIGALEASMLNLKIGNDGKTGGWGYKHGGKILKVLFVAAMLGLAVAAPAHATLFGDPEIENLEDTRPGWPPIPKPRPGTRFEADQPRADLFENGHLTGREGVYRLPPVEHRPSPTIERRAEPRRSW